MRVISLALLALCSTALLAQEQAQTAAPARQVFRRPLHRHPTLLGMLRRNNDIRRRVGLWPHRMNPALTKAAQDHANYMARTGDFQHYSNGGPQGRAARYGFSGGVRENIAWNYQGIEGAFGAWTTSSAHYASLASSTTDAGFGYAVGNNGSTYWVGVYANPAQGDEIGEPEGFAAAAEAKAKQEAEDLKAVQAGIDFENADNEHAESKADAQPKSTADDKPADKPAAQPSAEPVSQTNVVPAGNL
jgi:hypothetical protein